MTLYFRMLYWLTRYFILNNIHQDKNIHTAADMPVRVWPLDCDFNGHMNNARYLSLMDIGRTYFMAEKGLLKTMIKNRWTPVLNAADMTFIRPINPFKKFTLSTKLLGWDEKYVYMEQRFLEKGELRAVGLIKALFIHGREKVPMDDVMKYIDDDLPKTNVPEIIEIWNNMKKVKRELTN